MADAKHATFHRSNSSVIHVGDKPHSLSFSGCGFLGVYHIGVASCLKQHAPTLVKNCDRIYGCSAGSLMGCMLLADMCFGEVCQHVMNIVVDARSRKFGPLNPGFRLNETMIRDLRQGLPEDIHIRATGRLHVSLTRLSDMSNVIVNDFATRDELIQVLLCSCFVPLYSGIFPPKYRGVRYVDGGLSNNLPADHDTITVSPWSGSSDICPTDDGSVSIVDCDVYNTSIQLTASNLYRCSTMFFPPEPQVLKDFCAQGFRETAHYLRQHGLFESSRCGNISFSGELGQIDERRRITRHLSSKIIDPISTASSSQSYDDDVLYISDSHDDEDSDTDADVTSSDDRDVETTSGNDCVTSSSSSESSSRSVLTVVHVVHPINVEQFLQRMPSVQLPEAVVAALQNAFITSAAGSGDHTRTIAHIFSACYRTASIAAFPIRQSCAIAQFVARRAHQSLPDHVTQRLIAIVGRLMAEIDRHLRAGCTGIGSLHQGLNFTLVLLIDRLLAAGHSFASVSHYLDDMLKSYGLKRDASGGDEVTPPLTNSV